MSDYVARLNKIYNQSIPSDIQSLISLFSDSNPKNNISSNARLYLSCIYTKDLFITEPNPTLSDGETVEITNLLYDGVNIKDKLNEREYNELVNIKSTLDVYILIPDSVSLSEELICDIHKSLMKNILTDHQCGTYRKKGAKPSGSDYEYTYPTSIKRQLTNLISFYNNSITNKEITVSQRLLLSTIFFSEFLLIHPFSDGNGRTSRILFNYLLKDIIITPVSLCSNFEDRKKFIDVLECRSNCMTQFHLILPIFKYIMTMINRSINIYYRAS